MMVKVIQDCSFCERVLLVRTVNDVQENSLIFSEEITRKDRICVPKIEIDTQNRRKISNLTSMKAKLKIG